MTHTEALFFVATLTAALIAVPVSAQQGPAGVPGHPGLAETDPSVKPARAVAPPVQARKPATPECSRAKDVEQCKARLETRTTALEACKGKTGAKHKQCVQQKTSANDCGKSSDPARCEQYKKTRELCKDKLGRDHQQCLRDNLAPKK